MHTANMSADMREVWKRLADEGRVVYGKREDEWRYTQLGFIIENHFCNFTASAMQGCKL